MRLYQKVEHVIIMGTKELLISLILTICVLGNRFPVYRNFIQNGQSLQMRIRIFNSTHVICEKNISFPYSITQEQIQSTIQIDSFYDMDNLTLYASIHNQDFVGPILQIQKNMSRYSKIRKSSKGMIEMEGVSNKKDQQEQYCLHLPPKFSLLMVHCDRGIRKGDMLFLQKSYNFTSKIQGSQFFYIPCLDTSQLHIPFKTYVPAVSNYTKYNVTISILVYDLTRFQMFFGFTQPELLKEVNPYMAQIYSDDMIDFVKQILFTNNFYLVLFYFILSTLQTFMQIFAFKSQVQIWKNIQKKGGLSIKSLYQSLLCSVIVSLYLYDQEASFLYIFFNLLDIVLTLWKITKAVKMSLGSKFPFISLSYKDWYHNKTESVDAQAIHYTSYLIGGLYSIFLVYKFYPICYDAYFATQIVFPSLRKVYSFMLESSVAFIFTLGFVMMTPQLYINYRLKSVDHLPWKTLIYRFISTIIDDIFVFMVSVPWLQRVFCFRDDIIFVLYLIQRRIYRVDSNRIALSSTSVDLSKMEKQKTQ